MNAEKREESKLNDRAQQLLKVLVESYIRDGQPVGSRSLSRDSGLNLSAATIRNVMADLEAYGFVASPHTSAGRIPTPKGYRFFIDTLLKVQPLEAAAVEQLRRELGGSDDSRSLVSVASQLLSNVTQLAGVVTMPFPRPPRSPRSSSCRCLKPRAGHPGVRRPGGAEPGRAARPADPAGELRRAAGCLNEQFRGRTVEQVRQDLIAQLSGDARAPEPGHGRHHLRGAAGFAEPAGCRGDIEYVVAGETNLMGSPSFRTVEKLRRLFDAFNEKRDILHLLDHEPARPTACRSSSARNPATRSSTTAASSPRPTARTRARGRRDRRHRSRPAWRTSG
jgi:heat-inducible transcriptional repressor